MEKEKIQQIETALFEFIIRTSNGKTISDKETEILPEIVKILKEF